MPKPACVKCQRFLRPLKNGVSVLETKPVVPKARPGKGEDHLWDPYKVWHADLWQCEGCGFELITGWGVGPVLQDYQSSPQEMRRVHFTINDC